MKSFLVAPGILAAIAATPALAQSVPSTSAQTHDQISTAPAATKEQAAPAPANQKPIKLSSRAQKAVIDLQTAVNANDTASIPAKVAAAQAVASTPDDRYAIGQLRLKAALAAKDDAAMASAIDAIASSGFVDADTTSKLYASLGTTLFNAKQFDQAAAAFQKASTADPRNLEVYGLIGEARFAQGQKAEAVAAFQRAVQAYVAAGQKPDEALVKRAVTVAYDAQSPMAVPLARQWVAAYPSSDSWRNAIAIYRNLNHPDEEGTLDLLRLMQATNALTTPGDYALFAEAAADQNNFNEAQAVLDAGIAARTVDPTNPQFRDILTGLKSKPKATAADLDVALKSASTANALLSIGDRYYAMGNYAKAADLYRQSLAKGGDATIANLHLGMALARAGDKAGATAALNSVSGPRAEIAKYWLVYVQQHA